MIFVDPTLRSKVANSHYKAFVGSNTTNVKLSSTVSTSHSFFLDLYFLFTISSNPTIVEFQNPTIKDQNGQPQMSLSHIPNENSSPYTTPEHTYSQSPSPLTVYTQTKS